jgi:hypothetical protein
MMIQSIFVILMLLLAAIGFYCAAKMSHENPRWVRLIVMLPALTALATLATVARGHYVAYWPDIARSLSVILIYALVASHFSAKPWLYLRVKTRVKK